MKKNLPIILIILGFLILISLIYLGLQSSQTSSENIQVTPETSVSPLPTSNNSLNTNTPQYAACDSHKNPDYTVYCSDFERDANLYIELLKLPIVQKRFASEMTPEVRFEIWGKHANNIIYTDIGNYHGGGAALWLQKVNGNWEEVYSGQEEPSCDVLEKRGIEPGVDCLDPNSSVANFQKTH